MSDSIAKRCGSRPGPELDGPTLKARLRQGEGLSHESGTVPTMKRIRIFLAFGGRDARSCNQQALFAGCHGVQDPEIPERPALPRAQAADRRPGTRARRGSARPPRAALPSGPRLRKSGRAVVRGGPAVGAVKSLLDLWWRTVLACALTAACASSEPPPPAQEPDAARDSVVPGTIGLFVAPAPAGVVVAAVAAEGPQGKRACGWATWCEATTASPCLTRGSSTA